MTLQFILIVLVVGLLVGLAKGGFGGLAMIAVPLLTLIMPTKQAVASALVMLLLGDIIALWAFWRKWDPHILWVLVPAGAIGAFGGSFWLVVISDTWLKLIIGVLTLIYVAYRLVAEKIESLQYDPPDWLGAGAGLAAGITSALANAGAPPLLAYLLLKRLEPTIFVGTFTFYIAIINAIKLPIFIQTGTFQWEAFRPVSWAILFIPIGTWLGRYIVERVSMKVFNWIVLALLTVTGIVFLVTSFPTG